MSKSDLNVCVKRQIKVHTRTELYETEMLVYEALLAGSSICHNASCHCTCYLADKNLSAILHLDNYKRTFVLGTCLRQPSLVELTLLVLGACYDAVNRIPVRMDIKGTHKN